MVRLRRVTPYQAGGHTRAPSGSSFRYLDASGARLSGSELERVRALPIPPAWREVWIAPTANAHILAVGVDDAGRRQYLYHPQWRAARDAEKFERALDLAAALPSARARVTRDLAAAELTRERALAASFRLLDLVAVRIGAEQYYESNGSFGLSTLLVRHVRLDGDALRLAFPAKSGQRMRAEAEDHALALVAAELVQRTARSRFLAWRHDERFRPLSASSINEYVRLATGGEFTAKDFRTLRGTIAAADALAEAGAPGSEREAKRAIAAAYAAASATLGNTPAVAKASYVDPTVVDAYRAGELIGRSGTPENRLIELISRMADIP